jgi:hypothetical protein
MRPLRLHLDTSDYVVMYQAAPGTPEAHVRDQLRDSVRNGEIEIGLSYHVVFELLQKATPQFREDRLARARLLTELCRRNAFPYPTDLGHGPRFSTDGLWVPRVDLDDVEIERAIEHMMQIAPNHPGLSRHDLKILSKRKYVNGCGLSNPERVVALARELWPFLFGRAIVEEGDLTRYLASETTRAEVNRKLWFYITDPVTIYEIWFEQYGRDDPIALRREQMANKFGAMLDELQAKLEEAATLDAKVKEACAATGDQGLSPEEREALLTLRASLKTFRSEMSSPHELCRQVPIWKDYFGDQAALVAAQILYAFHREKRRIKRSDAIDFVHAMYLPYTDLWRGDKGFSDLLIKHRVNFSERVVPTLLQLPSRIEGEIAALKSNNSI